MLEIKTTMTNPEPAKPGRKSHLVCVDRDTVSWYGDSGSIFCFHYTKGDALTAGDFRRFGVILSEIADTLEMPNDGTKEAQANG